MGVGNFFFQVERIVDERGASKIWLKGEVQKRDREETRWQRQKSLKEYWCCVYEGLANSIEGSVGGRKVRKNIKLSFIR